MRTLTPIDNIKGKWHVAMIDPFERSNGALLILVHGWVLVSDDEHDDQVVPLVCIPDLPAPSLSLATDIDADLFLGLVEPGGEVNHDFDAMAQERNDVSRIEDDAREREKTIVNLITTVPRLHEPIVLEVFRNIRHNKLEPYTCGDPTKIDSAEVRREVSIALLANLGLIEPHFTVVNGSEVRWVLTDLGKKFDLMTGNLHSLKDFKPPVSNEPASDE